MTSSLLMTMYLFIMNTPLADQKLRYTLILTHSPSLLESNLTAQLLAAEILAAGDIIDRIFFYQDACYVGLTTQVPGQGLEASYIGWVNLYQSHEIPLQICIANSLRRGVLDGSEAKRYQNIENLHTDFKLVGLGEMAEACQSSDRIITL